MGNKKTSYFDIGDEVIVVNLRGYPVSKLKDPPRVGDVGHIVGARDRTWRVKIKRTGLKNNFLPHRIARTTMNGKDSRFIYG